MTKNLVYLHAYRDTQDPQPCRFPDGLFDFIHTIEGIPVAVMQSGNQFLADYHGHICRILFQNMRPHQLQIEGIFFAKDSQAWRTLLEHHPEILHLDNPPGIILHPQDSYVDQINQMIVDAFEKYIEDIIEGERRLLLSEDGIVPEDPSDTPFTRHLCYEHFLYGGVYTKLPVDRQPWNQYPIGTDVTMQVGRLIKQLPKPVQTWYFPSSPDELHVFALECPYCTQKKSIGKIDTAGNISRLTYEEYCAASKWLLHRERGIYHEISVLLAGYDECGCQYED